jgi:hypothetical protein
MRALIMTFALAGFVLGTLFGYTGHFLLSRGETHSAQAMPIQIAAPVLHYAGIDGAAPPVARTIGKAVLKHLSARGIRISDGPDACAARLAATFRHKMAADEVIVQLIWLLHAPDGREIARVQMRNTVPQDMLDGDWSGDAPHIARSVSDAVERIFSEVPPVC